MKIELRPHPAQARNPVTDEPLFNEDGSPVPLVPELRSIWLDGQMIGYTGSPPKRPISLIVKGVPDSVVDKIKAVVCDAFDLEEVEKVSAPPVGELYNAKD